MKFQNLSTNQPHKPLIDRAITRSSKTKLKQVYSSTNNISNKGHRDLTGVEAREIIDGRSRHCVWRIDTDAVHHFFKVSVDNNEIFGLFIAFAEWEKVRVYVSRKTPSDTKIRFYPLARCITHSNYRGWFSNLVYQSFGEH